MALSCFLRGASNKLRVSSLHSLTRTCLLPSTSIIGSSQSHHTLFSHPIRNSQKTIIKENVMGTTPLVTGPLLQNVKQFSLSAKNMSSHGHDHSKLWTVERAVAVGLLGLVPAAFLFPSTVLDYILAVTVVMHNHWGFEAVVVDYVRPILFGDVIPKIAVASVYIVSIATLAGLFFFINNDVGIVNAIKMLWSL